MAKVSPLIILPPLLFAGLAAVFILGLNRDDPDALPSAWIGKNAPALTTEPLSGLTPFTSTELNTDGIKLVNFWASWCAPCRVEHPNLQALADQGVTLYGINYKDKPDNAVSFLDELGNPYAKAVADPSGRTGLDWGLYGVPETFVIDADGTILLRHAGPVTKRVMDEKITPLLQ